MVEALSVVAVTNEGMAASAGTVVDNGPPTGQFVIDELIQVGYGVAISTHLFPIGGVAKVFDHIASQCDLARR